MMLSVIIPLYNAEKYIEKCIYSICNQTYKNIELLIINDGSTDHSVTIVKKLMNQDSRIKLFGQKNKGVSAARNYGLQMAKGEYVTFIDADDYLDSNVYEYIMNILNEKYDAAIYALKKQFDHNQGVLLLLPWKDGKVLYEKQIKSELVPLMIAAEGNKKNISGSVCRTIYKNSKIHGYYFNEKIHIQEDLLFCLNTYPKMKSIVVVNNVHYNYIKYSGTATEHYRENYYKESIKFEDAIVKSLKQNKLYVSLIDRYFSKRVGMYSLNISNLFRFDAPKDTTIEFNEIIRGFKIDEYINGKHDLKYLNCKMIAFYYLMKWNMSFIIKIIYYWKEKRRYRKLIEKEKICEKSK